MGRRWEYMVVGLNDLLEAKDAPKLKEILNKYGSEGWELVNVVDQVGSGFGYQPKVVSNLMFFKREL